MLMCKGAFLGPCFGSHHQVVFTASLEMMWLTALVAVRDSVCPTRRFSAQAPASITSLGPFCLFSVFSEMIDFTKFGDEQVSGQPNTSEELMTLLTAATVHKSILDGFRALGIVTCGRFASLADDVH